MSGDPVQPCGERKCLGVVARAVGRYTARSDGLGELAHGVVGAPELEGARLLEMLALEVELALGEDIRLDWSGTGDLDLITEEPVGTVCSFENRDSPGGGVLVHDGYGPEQDNCYEEYICAFGFRGDYRFRVRHAWGRIVGGRATLTIVQYAGSPEEVRETHAVVLDGGETVIPVTLEHGRRNELKSVRRWRRGLQR